MLTRLMKKLRGDVELGGWTEPILVTPIGWVRSPVKRPRIGGWESITSTIIIRDDLAPALSGLEAYSHIAVITWMHQVTDEARALLRIHPRGDASTPIQGVYATRTQNRPNPIGVAVVPLLRMAGQQLMVRGLDAIHGTPVVDIKPYIPFADCVPDARLPAWTRAAGLGYWLGPTH